MNETKLAIRNDMNLSQLGQVLAQSGYFQDARDAGKAIVKVLAGQELGIGPIAAMSGIHIIQGKPSIGANVIASLVKAHPRYDYRVKTLTDKGCTIIFYEGDVEIGQSVFTEDDAKTARQWDTKKNAWVPLIEKHNFRNYPRNMFFARAISNGVRWYCPDVFLGAPVYTPDELGAETDDEGNVIEGQFEIEQSQSGPSPSQQQQPKKTTPEQDEKKSTAKIARPYPPATCITGLRKKAGWKQDGGEWIRPDFSDDLPDTKAIQRAAAMLEAALKTDNAAETTDRRYAVTYRILGVESLKDCSATEVDTLLLWAEFEPGSWEINEYVEEEALAILNMETGNA